MATGYIFFVCFKQEICDLCCVGGWLAGWLRLKSHASTTFCFCNFHTIYFALAILMSYEKVVELCFVLFLYCGDQSQNTSDDIYLCLCFNLLLR